MKVDKDTELIVSELVDKYVPAGIDPLLHVDRRKTMQTLILRLLDKEAIPHSITAIIGTCKEWKSILCERSAYAN